MFKLTLAIALNVAALSATALAEAPAPRRPWQPANDCRANIAEITCKVAPQTKQQENDPGFVRPCLGGEKKYATELTKVHDELPPKLRKMFCHLRRIYVEEDFYATGYASRFAEVFRDKNGRELVRFNGNILGLSRQKVFDSKYDLSEWLNRKEQTLFGRKMEEPLSPAMPVLEMNYAGIKANPLLVDVVLHEFGHLLEIAHGFTSFEMADELKIIGLWPSISWMPDGSIRAEDRYFGEFRPCYYNCGAEKLAPLEQAAELFRRFVEGNNFVSLYASVNVHEDFAESFLYYISNNYFDAPAGGERYFYAAVKFPGEDAINLNSRMSRGRLLAKMNFMAMFDMMPWKYETEIKYSIPALDFAKRHALKACF